MSLPYQYVVLRFVPRVDREEFLNIGVVLYCELAGFLDCAWRLPEERLRALAPTTDLDDVEQALSYARLVCAGDPAAGGIAIQAQGARFGYLKAPRSTVVQPGPVHGGQARDPEAELGRLVDSLIG